MSKVKKYLYMFAFIASFLLSPSVDAAANTDWRGVMDEKKFSTTIFNDDKWYDNDINTRADARNTWYTFTSTVIYNMDQLKILSNGSITFEFTDINNATKRITTAGTNQLEIFDISMDNVKQFSLRPGTTANLYEFELYKKGPQAPNYYLKSDVVGHDSVTLSWTAVPSAVNYKLYRNGRAVKTTDKLTIKDDGLTSDTEYQYDISAVDAAGLELPRSQVLKVKTLLAPDVTPPDVPTNVKAFAMFEALSMSWIASTANDVAGYNVYVDGVKHNTSLISSTSHLIRSLTNGRTYQIQVTAVDRSGNESAKTAVVSGIPDGKQMPPVSFGYSLADITNGIGSWFAEIWLLLAFCIAIPLSFYVANRVKGLFA